MREQVLLTVGGTIVVINQPKEPYTMIQLASMLRFKDSPLLELIDLDENQLLVVDRDGVLNRREENKRASVLAQARLDLPRTALIYGDALVIDKKNIDRE